MSDELPKKPLVALEPPIVRQIKAQVREPENSYTLTLAEYEILSDGANLQTDDAARWGAGGAFVTVIGTVVGLLLTVKPSEILARGLGAFAAFFALLAFGAAAFAIALISQRKVDRLKGDSSYTRLKRMIDRELRQ